MPEIRWIASYPKSGNTWLRFMLACYLTREPMTSVKVEPLNSLIPVIGGGTNSNRDGLPESHTGPMMVKTHSLPGAAALRPYQAATKKAVYLVRNPRDIILSLTNARGAKKLNAEDIARDFIANRGMPLSGTEFEWGSWPQNVQAWTTPAVSQHFPGIEVMTVKYEDMRADPHAVLREILSFLDLGQPVAAEYVDLAVHSSSLENMHELWDREEKVSQDGRKVKRFRAGQGMTNQSLACLGPGIEEDYQKLFQADDDLAQCAKRFGYGG